MYRYFFIIADKLARLIARVAIVDELEPGKDWSVHWYRNDHIQLDYALRAECKHHWGGSTCNDYQASHSSPNACVCKDDSNHHRHKRDLSGPAYDLEPLSAASVVSESVKFHPVVQQLLMGAEKSAGQCPKQEPANVDSIADSVVQRMANMFAESVTSYNPETDPKLNKKDDNNKDTKLEEESSPIRSLFGKLTDIMNKSASGFEGVIKGDVIEGRQMAMRVASMIDETVFALNPVLTFINALLTMLRATRYMLVMANFVG